MLQKPSVFLVGSTVSETLHSSVLFCIKLSTYNCLYKDFSSKILQKLLYVHKSVITKFS